MLALARSLFDNVVLRRPTPYVLLFEPSQRCDCRCSFCYHWREHVQGEMPLDDIRRVLDEAHELGCRYLFLGGGEPLIAPHLSETLRHARTRGFRTIVTTNGSRLAERAAEIALWVERVSVSIDFPDERHDAVRRRIGLFRAAVDGILAAKRAGLAPRITMNVCSDNVADVPAMAQLARDLDCRLHARLMTRESTAITDLPILDGPDERARYVALMRQLRRGGYPIATPERYLRTVESGEPFTCRIARFVVNVDAAGRVYVPCPRHEGSKDRIFGTIDGSAGSLRAIWYGSDAAAFREEALACRPGVDCYSACVHDVSRLVEPDLRYWWDELLDDRSLGRFYLDALARALPGLGAATARGASPRSRT